MNLDRLIPPALSWRLNRKKREADEIALFKGFYSQFLSPGDLCYDIGANLGNRIRGFRALGCEVVALEPQSSCFRILERTFGNDPKVHLINQAAGAAPGEMELHVSPDHVLSTFSEAFIKRTSNSGRFPTSKWDSTETCRITTLDELILKHGMPRFVKIDVEGFESEVLAGLSSPVPALSIEWIPELSENAKKCLEHLVTLGDYEFHISWGESMKFSRRRWRSAETILSLIEEFSEETSLFADIYARLNTSTNNEN